MASFLLPVSQQAYAYARMRNRSIYLLITQQTGIAVVTVQTEDATVVVNITSGVDNSWLITRTLYALASNSVAIVTDFTLITVVTCPGNNNIIQQTENTV